MKFKRTIVKENLQVKRDPVGDYRRLANIDESVQLTEDKIDDFALQSVSAKYNIQPYDLKHMILGEAVTIDQAARELEAEKVAAENKNQVEKVLDRSLKIARRKAKSGDHGDFPNVLLISDAGFGKRVENSRLADVGQTDDATLQTHDDSLKQYQMVNGGQMRPGQSFNFSNRTQLCGHICLESASSVSSLKSAMPRL